MCVGHWDSQLMVQSTEMGKSNKVSALSKDYEGLCWPQVYSGRLFTLLVFHLDCVK